MDIKLKLTMTLSDADEGEIEITSDAAIDNVDQMNIDPGSLIHMTVARMLDKMADEGLAQLGEGGNS